MTSTHDTHEPRNSREADTELDRHAAFEQHPTLDRSEAHEESSCPTLSTESHPDEDHQSNPSPATSTTPRPRTRLSTYANDESPNRSTRSDTPRQRRPAPTAQHDPVPAQAAAEAPAGPADDDEPEARRFKPLTWAIIAAAIAFTVVVLISGMRLIAGVDDLDDTPARSVDGFLTALLDDQDSAAAADWLCAEKRDRDLNSALLALADLGEHGITFHDVTEVNRDVGSATVTAELRAEGETALWTFTLVAEDSNPQWVVCDVANG
ncbi:hypothetical protein [Natronoglycomyces albus]|uniref:DUF4878 domain-containing protein n=1 Tax=Natronoglycomyces albus TaxID=2811108 RepID=A0A895XVB0_9ACTN|nr:hypothetical protein [Natronoglycomyces albus]QSB05578.1 hypothetical protein JQS30_01180 [Natronoglycomyces albus]